jgi:hypothetical protein
MQPYPPYPRERIVDDLKARLRELAAHHRQCAPAIADEYYMLGDEAADRIERLEAENARLSTAVCSGILGDLLTADEGEALVAFVKDLRARSSHHPRDPDNG